MIDYKELFPYHVGHARGRVDAFREVREAILDDLSGQQSNETLKRLRKWFERGGRFDCEEEA